MKSLGFKATIITSVAALITLCLMAANWLSYITLKEAKIQNVDEISASVVNNEAYKIESWFQDKMQVIDSLTTHYQVGISGDSYVELAALSEDMSGLSMVVYGLDDGRSFASLGPRNPSEYDPRTREWYQKAKATNGLVLTDVYNAASTGKPVISISESVSDGVILGDIELDILSEVVNGIQFPGAVTLISDDSGKVIASNSKVMTIGTHFTDVGMGDVQQIMLSQDESYFHYELDGVEKLSFTKGIDLAKGQKWYLFIGVDKSVAYAAVDEALTNAIVASLIMLTIGILLGITILNVIYRPILTLKEVVIDLSQGNGDLTRRLPVTSNDDLGQISGGINAFIANLQTLMLEVSQSSDHISGSVEQLKRQTDANNEVLNAHSTETDQIVAAVEEMSATAGDVASNAAEASQFTHSANLQVSDSRNIVTNAATTVSQLVEDVERTSNSIAEIGKDTVDITNVLKVIGDIADQTNLLALNAAIEAARAGEQGRGFAVVADEVRALASRTQVSTAEIEQTLSKLQNGSTTTITAMESTKLTCKKTAESTTLVAKDLDAIALSVTQINDLNAQIATAAEEQSSVAGEITRNMASIREIVGELSASGEATASETINLAAANSQLKSVVGKFKLQ